jgi:hypothetical protein
MAKSKRTAPPTAPAVESTDVQPEAVVADVTAAEVVAQVESDVAETPRTLLSLAEELHQRLAAIGSNERSDHAAVARDRVASVIQLLEAREHFINQG